MDHRLYMIFRRRSVRQYTDAAITRDDIQGLLEAGMAAPSASNKRPWHFVVSSDRPTLEALAGGHPFGKMLARAPLAIAVCADPSLSRWWTQDCSAATENILLAASELGLGAVWLGCHGAPDRERSVREILAIPDHISVLSLVSIGHPAEKKAARTQFDPTRVHNERW